MLSKLINFLMVFILLNSVVYAFGVTLPYHPVDGLGQLDGQPGQNLEVKFLLQNWVGTEDITIKVTINEGKDIAKIKGPDEIVIPAKTKDIEVPVEVSIPKTAKAGDKFLVSIYLRNVVSDRGGTSLGTAIEQRFYVNVYELTLREKIDRLPFQADDIVGFIIILGILIATIIFFHKRKK